MSKLYQLFSELSNLSKEQQRIKLSNLEQTDSVLTKKLSSLLCNQNATVDSIFNKIQENLIESNEHNLRIGRLINNKYQITKLLGQGGMSDVYKAKRIDGIIEHTVAVKYFALADSYKTALEMLQKEAQILADLDHHHIASFIDIGHDNSEEPNIMMEYIEGITLYEFLNTTPKDKAKHQVNTTLLAAIEYAKSKGVEHNDISKNNVLIDKQGNANIIDFDIASYQHS